MTHTLQRELAGLPNAALTYRPKEKEWSIKETAGHLCDAGHVLHKRLYMMINLEEPHLPDYDRQEMVSRRDAQSAPIDELLVEFAAQRAETVDMLADLVHWNWARTGRHPMLGRISIRQQVDLWLEHEAEHLEQIRRLKATAQAS
ncbi:MAG: DinB family protein [Dehalococcoidia bacterium]